MKPRIFVVDTDIVVAGLITSKPASPTAMILDAMLAGDLLYLLSAELLSEYRSVLLRPGLVRLHGLNEFEIDHLLTEITANAIWREPQPNSYQSSPDPQDDHLTPATWAESFKH